MLYNINLLVAICFKTKSSLKMTFISLDSKKKHYGAKVSVVGIVPITLAWLKIFK